MVEPECMNEERIYFEEKAKNLKKCSFLSLTVFHFHNT